MGLSSNLSCEAGSLSCCCPNPHGPFQSEVWGFISPCWSPGLRGLLCSPQIVPVYLCASVGPRGATRHSACPVLRHSESGPLGLSVRECGVAGSASGQTACPVRPTLRQSWSRHSHASPLRPSYGSGCMFLFYLLGVGLPCRSIFCQFWLCEEAQCVYLHRHLGSPPHCLFFKDLVIFRERARMGEREWNIDVWEGHWSIASHTPPTGVLAHNPVMCLTGSRTSDLSVWRLALSPLSHTSQGCPCLFKFPCDVGLERRRKPWLLFQL